MAPSRTRTVGAALLAAALLLAGCGSKSDGGSDSAGSTTTAAGSSASSTTSGGGDTGSSGSTVPSGSTKGPDCKTDVKAAAEKALGASSFDVKDLGGACTVRFGEEGAATQVSHLWNYGAGPQESWDGLVSMMDKGLKPVSGIGDDARGGVENGAARLDVWVEGKGAYQLTIVPAYPAEASAKDVDTLKAVAQALMAG